MKDIELPQDAEQAFRDGQVFLRHVKREASDWREDVVKAVTFAPADPDVGVLRRRAELLGVSTADLCENLLNVSKGAAMNVLRFIAGGSLIYGPASLSVETAMSIENCIASIFSAFGDCASFFTNHGAAEDGAPESCFSGSYHVNVVASSVMDLCIIAVSDDEIFIGWRCEED
ncbi:MULTISPECIES: hypothetical protein [Streptomyces]|uniref:hypothetical protein n=1 Tax=Streptomyces TaxID=1883 RepID=UPI0022488031|nr:hypothetical protein [Streptomyces sp. JHD 1]MCX2971828.1 hypothetical protein [Streptomyces sp. JHD 1]